MIHDVHRAVEAYYADAGCAFVAIAFFLALVFVGQYQRSKPGLCHAPLALPLLRH